MNNYVKQFHKRGLALFLALIMCLSLLPAQAMAAEAGQNTRESVGSVATQIGITPGVAEPVEGKVNSETGAGTYYFPHLEITTDIQEMTIWFSTGSGDGDVISLEATAGITVTPLASAEGLTAKMNGIQLTVDNSVTPDELEHYLAENLRVEVTSNRDYAISFGSIPKGCAYNPENGHFYTYAYGKEVKDENGTVTGYEPGKIEWTAARDRAHEMKLEVGEQDGTPVYLDGYLVTITSEQEQRFIENLFKGQFWTAGTREAGLYAKLGSKENDPKGVFQKNSEWNAEVWSDTTIERAKNSSRISNPHSIDEDDPNATCNGYNRGAWFWGDGPELGRIYYPFTVSNATSYRHPWDTNCVQTDDNGSEYTVDSKYKEEFEEAVAYNLDGWMDNATLTLNGHDIYINWAKDDKGSEPNNRGGYSSEEYMHVYGQGISKNEDLHWNDYPADDNRIQGFLVEFGGFDDDPKIIMPTAHISLKKGTEVTTVIAETGTTKAAVPASGLASDVFFTPESKLNGKEITVDVTHTVYPNDQEETALTIPGTAGTSDVVAEFIDTSKGYHSYYSIKEVEVAAINLAAKVSCVTEDTKHAAKTSDSMKADSVTKAENEDGLVFKVTTEKYVDDFDSEVNNGLEGNARVTHTSAADTVTIQLVLEKVEQESAETGEKLVSDKWTVKVLKPAETEGGEDEWIAAEKTDDAKFVVPMAAQCQPAPKLTNVKKDVVTAPVEGLDLPAGIEITYPKEGETIKLGEGDSVTLLYAITVYGDEGAAYKVTDEGATFVDPTLAKGTLGETGEAILYAYRTFKQNDINGGKLTNKVVLNPDPDPDPDDPDNPNPPPVITDEAETPAEKLYKVTVKYVDDKGNTVEIPVNGEYISEQSSDKLENGTFYMEKVEGFIYSDFVAQNGDHYVKESQTTTTASGNGEYTSDVSNDDDLIITVVYTLDNWDKDHPDPDPDPDPKPDPGPDPDRGDGIPDKYQVKVVYTTDGNGTVKNWVSEDVYRYSEILSIGNKVEGYKSSGNVTIWGTTATAKDDYQFSYWDADDTDDVMWAFTAYDIIKALTEMLPAKSFPVQGGHVYTFTANFVKQPEPPVEPEEPRIITLSYDPNGGTGSMEPQSKTTTADHVVFTVKDNEFTAPEGMVFIGWKAATGDKVWQAGEEIRLEQNMTLYAQWTPVTTPMELHAKYFICYLLQDDDGGYHYAPEYDEVRTVTLGSKDAEVPVTIGAADIKDIPGYTYSFSETLKRGLMEGVVKAPTDMADIVTLYLYYTKDIAPQDGDLTVTKVSDWKTAQEGDTVTWTITVKNNSNRVYENLSVSDALTVTKMDATQKEISLSISLGRYTEGTVTVDNVMQRFNGWTPYGLERPEDEDTVDVSEVPSDETSSEENVFEAEEPEVAVPEEDIPETAIPEEDVSEESETDFGVPSVPVETDCVSATQVFFDGPEGDDSFWENLLKQIYDMDVDPGYFDLYPGEEVTFTVSYTVGHDDRVLGNTVTVTGRPPVKAEDIPVNRIPTDPPAETKKVAYLVYWLDKDVNALKTVELRSGDVDDVVKPTDADKAKITNNGVTYKFDDSDKNNVLEGTLSADGLVILKLYFTKTAIPTTGMDIQARYMVQYLDKDGNQLKTAAVRGPLAIKDEDGNPVTVEVIDGDKADIVLDDGTTYKFDAENTANVLEGELSATTPVILKLYFAVVPTNPGIPPVNPTPPTITPNNPVPPTPSTPSTTITDDDVPLANAVGLNDAEHFAYIIGYEDDTVRPLNNITRAEAVTIFFRLMTDEHRAANWSTENSFSDVNVGNWYNNAVSTCLKAGALEHFAQDDAFLPNQAITRAEFASIAAGFISDEITGENVGDFKDTEGHWAAEAIRKAVEAGWITGVGGNRFDPDATITRAEVMTMINRMLDRTPDKDHMLPTMKVWTDNPESAWYYEAVQEATNEHDYERDEMSVETWTELLTVRDWQALETEWANNGGVTVSKTDSAERWSNQVPDGI